MMYLSLTIISTVLSTVSSLFTPNQRILSSATQKYQIPGGSPWRHCVDPSDDLFKIDSAGMSPNPCMVESLCKVNITGSLTEEVTNATISWNITTHFNDGRVGQIPGIDDFYRWVNVYQNDSRTHHLQRGPALMNQSSLLLGGWVPVSVPAGRAFLVRTVNQDPSTFLPSFLTNSKLTRSTTSSPPSQPPISSPIYPSPTLRTHLLQKLKPEKTLTIIRP
ncbi:MAG: hypothetical protein Q9184_006756 [Pyrenodesmia sp. 2 TL-2023]